MEIHKAPGNDGLAKQFYERSYDEIKEICINSEREAKNKGKLNILKRQTIKIIEDHFYGCYSSQLENSIL